jgi:raffinose/stachyose/melibiose transport system substrate-binding protein
MKVTKFAVLLLILVAPGMLMATGTQEKEHELRYLTPQVGAESSAETIATLVEEWNAAHEGEARVVIDGVPDYTQYLNSLKTKVAADQGPDLFYYNDPIDKPDFWGYNKLGDITSFVDQEFLAADTEQDWNDCKIGDRIYAFPYLKLMTMIFYNKEIFRNAGVAAPIPTWDEWFTAGDKIKALGVSPFAGQNTDNSWTVMLMHSAYMGSAGGPNVWKNLQDFNDPVWLEGAKFLDRLWDYTTPDSVNLPYQAASANYLTEKAAMIANGPWMIAQIKDEGMYEKTGYMPYPGVAGKGMIVQAGPLGKMSTFYKNDADPERMKLVVDFMKYHNNVENTKRLILASAGAYATTATFTDADPLEPLLKDIYGWINKVPWTIPYFSAAILGFQNPFTEELGLLWTDLATPEEFIEHMNEKVFKE